MTVSEDKVRDLQDALASAIDETIADMGDDWEVDEGSVAADLFASLTWDDDVDVNVAAEVARREFGFVPFSSRPGVSDAFNQMNPDWEF